MSKTSRRRSVAKTTKRPKRAKPAKRAAAKKSTVTRGELMRRIAALHAKSATAARDGNPRGKLDVAQRVEIKRQIEELEKQMMAL